MRLLWLILAVTLTACSGNHWTKPATTQEEYERDTAECERQARFYKYVYLDGWYRDCMVARGYKLR